MITAVILTKDEANNIRECLKTLDFCDERIVIDTGSADETVKLAKETGAKVIPFKFKNDFSAARNFALSEAKNSWVLFIDADERVSPGLKAEMTEAVKRTGISGWFVRRMDHLFGKELKYGETANMKLLRLARKDAGKWEGSVHEKWMLKGECCTFVNPLDHYPHQTVSGFLAEVNRYTDLVSTEWHKKGKTVSVWEILFYPKGKFLMNYFLKLGFLDGVPGFIVAMMMSFHSFLARAKLWLLLKK